MDILDAQRQSVSFMPQQQENQTHTFILEFSTFQITLTRKKEKKGGSGSTHIKTEQEFIFWGLGWELEVMDLDFLLYTFL